MRTIVVSAVNIRKGGTLTILRQCLEYLSKREDVRVVALVHDRALCEYPNIEYIEIPWTTKSWFHRLWCEYMTMHRLSKQLTGPSTSSGSVTAGEPVEPVDVWLSMHDTTPRVVAKKQEVYCHTSFPFLKWTLRDLWMDPKIPLFAMFTRFAYRINVHRNDCLIVQQEWFAEGLSGLLGVPRNRFRVIPPSRPEMVLNTEIVEAVPNNFLYVSTADCHKNFETLCEAARMLEKEGREFCVTITVSGDENRYAKWLHRKWGDVKSIKFVGRVKREEVFDLYRKSGVFVFPSRVETWGLPISEYMSANPKGTMLLADMPYAHETSRGAGDARFFPATDAKALAAMMRDCLSK